MESWARSDKADAAKIVKNRTEPAQGQSWSAIGRQWIERAEKAHGFGPAFVPLEDDVGGLLHGELRIGECATVEYEIGN